MLISEGLIPSILEKKRIHALLAAPSTGGEVKRIFKALLNIPVTSFFDDRGCIMADKRIPFLQELIHILSGAVWQSCLDFIQMFSSSGFNVFHQD